MKKKVFSLILIMCCLILTPGCDKDNSNNTNNNSKTNNETQEKSTKNDVLFSTNGVDIKSVALKLVGDTFNFQVSLANNNSEDTDFDLSKFDIKSKSKSMKIDVLSSKTLGANKPHIMYAFTISDTGDLKVGDTVKVYYDTNLIDTIKVTEF